MKNMCRYREYLFLYYITFAVIKKSYIILKCPILCIWNSEVITCNIISWTVWNVASVNDNMLLVHYCRLYNLFSGHMNSQF